MHIRQLLYHTYPRNIFDALICCFQLPELLRDSTVGTADRSAKSCFEVEMQLCPHRTCIWEPVAAVGSLT